MKKIIFTVGLFFLIYGCDNFNYKQNQLKKELNGNNFLEERFVDNKDGTVTDKHTMLTWKRCSEGKTWNGFSCTGNSRNFYYQQAQYYKSDYLGFNDWRLPTYEEATSIIRCSNGKKRTDDVGCFSEILGPNEKPVVNKMYFSGLEGSWLSEKSSNKDYAYISFYSGSSMEKYLMSEFHNGAKIILVRDSNVSGKPILK